MKQIGSYLIFFGAGSIILSLMNMNFALLMWIDMWGYEMGWFIRILFVLAGILLMFLGNNAEKKPEQEV